MFRFADFRNWRRGKATAVKIPGSIDIAKTVNGDATKAGPRSRAAKVSIPGGDAAAVKFEGKGILDAYPGQIRRSKLAVFKFPCQSR